MAVIIQSYYLEHKAVFAENFRQVLDNFDMEAIHKMRTSTKRLRALFQMIQFLTDGKFKAKKQLKKLRTVFKHAGNIREIQIESLLVKQYELLLNETFPEYLEYLKKREHKEIVGFLKSIPPIENRDRILKDDKVLAVIDQLQEDKLHEGTAAFVKNKTQAILENIHKRPSNHRIHLNRTFLKQLYYLYEMLAELTDVGKIIKTNVERIREMEQFLGSWHDLVNSPVYMNAFLKTRSVYRTSKYKMLKSAIAADRKKMRREILEEFYPELEADIYTAK
ncbi:MAG: CHAD domain-containing protein [Bacteroidetes bacterium]|nr:CHAD domain-containing protein [Bacteroidota bacterium]